MQKSANAADIRATVDIKVKKAQSWEAHNVLAPEKPVNEVSLVK